MHSYYFPLLATGVCLLGKWGNLELRVFAVISQLLTPFWLNSSPKLYIPSNINKITFICLFGPTFSQKSTHWSQNWQFSHFYDNQFFTANSTSTKTLILYVFFQKYMEEKIHSTWDIKLCSSRGRKKNPQGLFQLVSIPKQL